MVARRRPRVVYGHTHAHAGTTVRAAGHTSPHTPECCCRCDVSRSSSFASRMHCVSSRTLTAMRCGHSTAGTRSRTLSADQYRASLRELPVNRSISSFSSPHASPDGRARRHLIVICSDTSIHTMLPFTGSPLLRYSQSSMCFEHIRCRIPLAFQFSFSSLLIHIGVARPSSWPLLMCVADSLVVKSGMTSSLVGVGI